MPRSTVKPTSIGLVFLHSLAYYRRALRGIWRYVEARPSWELMSIVPEEQSLKMHPRLRPDGLIVTANTKELDQALRTWHRPAVNVSAVIATQRFPRVGVDNVQVGQMAAAHFIERGLRHFAFVGPPNQLCATERQTAFCQPLEDQGLTANCYISSGKQSS